MKRLSIAGLGALALIATLPCISQIPGMANAQNVKNQSQLQLHLEAEKQVVAQDQQGKQSKTWEPLKGQTVVKPGDVLRYTLIGENKSDRQVKNLTLNQPIPQGMVYVLKSANATNNAKISFSVIAAAVLQKIPQLKLLLLTVKLKLNQRQQVLIPTSVLMFL